MRKAAAKLQKKLQPYKKIVKFMGTGTFFSLFTLFRIFAVDKRIKLAIQERYDKS